MSWCCFLFSTGISWLMSQRRICGFQCNQSDCVVAARRVAHQSNTLIHTCVWAVTSSSSSPSRSAGNSTRLCSVISTETHYKLIVKYFSKLFILFRVTDCSHYIITDGCQCFFCSDFSLTSCSTHYNLFQRRPSQLISWQVQNTVALGLFGDNSQRQARRHRRGNCWTRRYSAEWGQPWSWKNQCNTRSCLQWT